MTHNCKLATATVLRDSDRQVLLVKYDQMPDHQRGWFMPHELMNEFEHPRDAAARALLAQLGVEVDVLPLRHIESFRGRDGTWHLSFHFLARVPDMLEPPTTTGIVDARWFARTALPSPDDVSHHGWALEVLEAVTRQGLIS